MLSQPAEMRKLGEVFGLVPDWLTLEIGGETGWYYGNWLWKIRGAMDLMLGGVGVRRGRRDPDQVRVGDTVDFWRVEQIVDNKILRLSAEMKVPGRAWLEFEVTEEGGTSTSLIPLACLGFCIGTHFIHSMNLFFTEC